MKIEVNKDFLREYKSDVWKGFSGTELVAICTSGAIIAGSVIFLYLEFNVSPTIGVYMSVPLTIPVLLLGFYKYQGYLNPIALLKECFEMHRCKKLSYETKISERISTRVFTMKRKETNELNFKSK